MAETSVPDSPQEELEYGSEPAIEDVSLSPRARGRKRRSADVNNGLVSPSISAEPKDPAQGKRAKGEEAAGKRVRKANPLYADYSVDKEPANGKGRKEILLTPAEARTKKLAKGYTYVTESEVPAPPHASTTPVSGKRERKKTVHADFVDDAGVAAKPPKKISVTISNPNTNPTLSNGRRSSRGAPSVSTPEPVLEAIEDKPAKRTKSEVSRQAKLDHTLTMLNDQLAAVTSSIRSKEVDVSLPPMEPEADASGYVDESNELDIDDAEDGSSAVLPTSTPTITPSPVTTPRGRGTNKRPKAESSGGGRAKRKPRNMSPPSPSISPSTSTPSSTARPVRTRVVRTPAAIAGDAYVSRGLKKCQELLRELQKHEHAWPFAKPVDPVALLIPDYFDIIKHPMDFGTIKTQLTHGSYDTIDSFAEDVRLVFFNCRTYNKPDSDIVIMAKVLEELFERRLAAVKAQGMDDEEPPSSRIEEKMEQLSSQLKEATKEIERLKRDRTPSQPAPPTAKQTAKGRPRDDNRPMSFEEKRRLSIQINSLSSEKLGKVVQIIHESNPKLAQSSAPDVIEIDIDALDTSTLRHLERVVRQSQPRQRSTSSANASPAPSKLAQAELAASGTKERIADVKRQLDALNRSLGTKGKKNGKSLNAPEEEDVVIDDDAPSKARRDSDSSSSDSSSSGSSSESDSSDTSSDSDSESDQEQPKTQPKPTPLSNKFPFPSTPTPVNSLIQPTHAITTVPISNSTINHPPPSNTTSQTAPQPRTPPLHDGVVFSIDKTQAPAPAVEAPVPEIKASTGPKKAPEAISWNTTLLDTPAVTESPATPPTNTAGAADPMWSQFQNKNNLLKQKEKEREEQEELMRKEREEREEERRKEEEKRKKEAEEAEVKKQRDSEAEKEQKHKQMMEQRAKAKEERERMQGKNMSEQFDVMASFERENRGGLTSQGLSSLVNEGMNGMNNDVNGTNNNEVNGAAVNEATSDNNSIPQPMEDVAPAVPS